MPKEHRWVSQRELQDLFNNGNYLDRIRSGALKPIDEHEEHAKPYYSGEPWCTVSQIIRYLDYDGNDVVMVHRYLRSDRTIGASGLPDPRWIVIDGVYYTGRTGT